MILYRPVGIEELALIFDAEMMAFPPRLPDQPIFYPVTNFPYAGQIAREWNTKSGSLAGYVTRFSVEDEYVARFDRQVVGGREHEELWVPAEELDEFNRHLEGRIEVEAAWFGEPFAGLVPDRGVLKGMDAIAQFGLLSELAENGSSELHDVVSSHARVVFCHFPFWREQDFPGVGDSVRNQLLKVIEDSWSRGRQDVVLPRNFLRETEEVRKNS